MMRAAGAFNAQVMDFIRPHVRAGVTTGVPAVSRWWGDVFACGQSGLFWVCLISSVVSKS